MLIPNISIILKRTKLNHMSVPILDSQLHGIIKIHVLIHVLILDKCIEVVNWFICLHTGLSIS